MGCAKTQSGQGPHLKPDRITIGLVGSVKERFFTLRMQFFKVLKRTKTETSHLTYQVQKAYLDNTPRSKIVKLIT